MALVLVVAGVVLFFLMYTYSMPVLISGFLLLSIHTLGTVGFKQPDFWDFFKLFTALLFGCVAVCYIANYSWGYWLLIVAVLCQIMISLSGLLFVKKKQK